MFKFTSSEVRDLIIAFLFISLCFAILYARRDTSFLMQILPMIMIAVGLGFILHELGHKFVSMKYGYWAEFKLWPQRLILALVTSFFGFVFAAPGAVYTYANSVAGPVVNIILSLVFLLIAASIYPQAIYSETFATVFLVCSMGFSINSYLAVFNMIPIGNLDGSKVLRWNIGIWIVVIGIAGVMTYLSMTTGFENIVRLIIGF